MLVNKKDSIKIKDEINKVIESYAEKINDNTRFSSKQRYMANVVFMYKKIVAEYKKEHKNYDEEEIYSRFSKAIKLDEENQKTYEIAERLSRAVIEGEPVLDLVGECVDKIKETYEKYSKEVYYVSPESNLKEIDCSKGILNEFRNELFDGIDASSDYETIMSRAIIGNVNNSAQEFRNTLICENNPFEDIVGDDKLKLKKAMTIYSLDIKNFEPVINYVADSANEGIIEFNGEWISREDKEISKTSEKIEYVDKKIFESRQIFIKITDLDVLEKIVKAGDDEEILDILELFIEEGEIEYLNAKVGINTIKILKDANDRSDKRTEIARKVSKELHKENVEESIKDNIDYNDKEIELFRKIELEEIDEERENNIINKEEYIKRLIKELQKISYLLGMKARVISIKNKKIINTILLEKGEKEVTKYIIGQIQKDEGKELDFEVVNNYLYTIASRQNEEISHQVSKEIKEKGTLLLDLIYFRINGISEKAIYSFIIDRCDDDLEAFEDRIEKVYDVVRSGKIKELQKEVQSFVISKELTKDKIMYADKVKNKIKDFFYGKGQIIHKDIRNENMGNINQKEKK